MDQHEKYLYDLQGYITVPDALDADQLRRLNEEVDRHIEAECPPDMLTHRFFDTIDWGGPLLELIDNPRVRPYLDSTIGEDAYRLDHVYLDVIRSGKAPLERSCTWAEFRPGPCNTTGSRRAVCGTVCRSSHTTCTTWGRWTADSEPYPARTRALSLPR